MLEYTLDYSTVHKKLLHLSKEELDRLIERYYAGDKIKDIAKDFSILGAVANFHEFFPQKIYTNLKCPYCETFLISNFKSRTSNYDSNSIPHCDICKHDHSGSCYCQRCRSICFENINDRKNLINILNHEFFVGSPSWYIDLDFWMDKYNLNGELIYNILKLCHDNNLPLSKQSILNLLEKLRKFSINSSSDVNVFSAKLRKCNSLKFFVKKKLRLSRQLTEFEADIVDKWILELGYYEEIIDAVLKKSTNPNFKYLDAVLRDWHSNGLKDLNDILQFEENKRNNKKKALPTNILDNKRIIVYIAGKISVQNANDWQKDNFLGKDFFIFGGYAYVDDNNQESKSFDICFEMLEKAKVVFCWANNDNIYDILFEIGLSKALKKPIFLAYSKSVAQDSLLDKLGAAINALNQIVTSESVEDAWQMFCDWCMQYVKHPIPAMITEKQKPYLSDLINNSIYKLKDINIDDITKDQAIEFIKFFKGDKELPSDLLKYIDYK